MTVTTEQTLAVYGRIYLVTNTVNGKVYVGQTTRSIEIRWGQHCSEDDGSYFHNAIQNYGSNNFTIVGIEQCSDQESLDEAEMRWIAHYQSFTDRSKGYNRTAGGDRPIKRTPITEAMVLGWCDAFFNEHSEWPGTYDTRPVPGQPDETWPRVSDALSQGYRTLPGGSSLARLLEEERGRVNIQNLPILTEGMILGWCDAFFDEYGEWPGAGEGRPVPDQPNESWHRLEDALKMGLRGLDTKGSSLALLLQRDRGKRNIGNLPPLTEEMILDWCDSFFDEYGEWPTVIKNEIRPVPGQPDETWRRIAVALQQGLRGLPKSSLAELLRVERGRRNRQNLPSLTEKMILDWCDSFFEEHGEWPRENDSRPVPGSEFDTWCRISDSLKKGQRGLTKMSLAQLLERERNAKNGKNLPSLTEKMILGWCDSFFDEHGKFPTCSDTRPVSNNPGMSWGAVNTYLTSGGRGLAGTSSLADLLKRERGRRNQKDLPPLTEGMILGWCDSFFDRYHEWPRRSDSREVPGGYEGDSWSRIDYALRNRSRGLTHEKLSLPKLLADSNRGIKDGKLKQRLSEDLIFSWAKSYLEQHGVWPKGHWTTPVPESPDDTWQVLEVALSLGCRGLSKGSSLAKLIRSQRV